MKRFVAATLAVCLFGGASVEARENYALLVGVSSYPSLDEQFWLVGPANDVDLVKTYLTTNPHVPFEAGNITVLADGVPGAGMPTLAAIRGGFADLAGRLQPDDFVYLHFSGHGTQAPALDPETEQDGLDELFLPADIGPWQDSIGTVENALVDDEIGQLIASLRATGATVWAVFDSCHSGTVTRAAPSGDDEVRLRKLDPSALGVPSAAMDRIVSRALPGAAAESPVDMGDTGGFVAFYAAQTNETTPEIRLPQGAEDRRSQGVFTFTLFEALAARPGITYRQLAQDVLRRYAVSNLARSTPLFEGDLDTPVFGSGEVSEIQQWPLQNDKGRLSVQAGHLHGLSEGMQLALMASPADPTDAALGLVQVEYAENFSSDLLSDLVEIPRGAYLRKISESLDYGMTVALPEEVNAVLEAAMVVAGEREMFGARIGFVAAGEEADIRLAVREGALLVLPGTGILAGGAFAFNPTIRLDDKSPEALGLALSDTLNRMARVQNLLKLGGAFHDGALDVEVDLETRSPDQPRLVALESVPVPTLVPEDEVHVVVRNLETFPMDLNVLYVGSDYSISHIFAERLQPGDRLKQGLVGITDAAYGRDRLILILTPAEKHSALEDLSFLAQEALPVTRALRGGAGFAEALAEAGFGTTMRAATALGGRKDNGADPVMLMYDIDTRPKN